MSIRIGINGFGRIGRNLMRAIAATDTEVEVVAVNDLTDPGTLAHLLRYDSVHGRYRGSVTFDGDQMVVDGAPVKVLAERDPAKLPWKDLGVDVVLESTGIFTQRDKAALHLEAGARKVIISAPAKQEDITIVMGINQGDYDPENHHVISNASCTTNCLAPVIKVMLDNFGFERGFMTTVHAYTNDQPVLDLQHKDLRRARAAAMNIIPTSTGAAKATALVIPEVKGRLDGVALRVPVCDVSMVDLTCSVARSTDTEAVNGAFRAAAGGALEGILAVSDEPLVSSDYIGNPHSSIVDALSTNVIEGTLVHVSSWYDNEMAYCHRCIDLIQHVGGQLG